MAVNEDRTPTSAPEPSAFDPFSLGRRLRHLRKERGLTLAQVAASSGMAASQLSLLENGKRDAKLSSLQALAQLYGASLDDLTAPVPTRRAQLEIELERLMHSGLARSKGLPAVRISPRMPMDVLEALVALHRELAHDAAERIATPEEARRANAKLREEMRAQDNYFPDLEAEAAKLLKRVGYDSGPLSQHFIGEIAEHLGFTLHHVGDLPHSTRSVTDLKSRRIYLPAASSTDHEPRSVLLQALGHFVLEHSPPTSYGDFLRQRIETNYFAAALLLPETPAVGFLQQAKQRRALAVEDLRDAFAVSYEAASHRFTNLATRHLDIPVHFQRVHESGIIYKAYENDGVTFPKDNLGAIEGQPVCRFWTSRQVFEVPDKFNAFNQFTDTPGGTYWCTARVERASAGYFSTCIGVRYRDSKWFRGRDTRERSVSRCPDFTCCRRAPEDLTERWAGYAWPSARAHAHLLAALPPGTFPGVDDTEVFQFLDSHA
ncbi:helix-turn-helix domain-containing protein [Tessaracoccus sp. OS52]|uniref:helix-turn-helix transcriptional regulator n=1 Tax=Tessaracoccus sp. OS52 TaxID=2886691 RepID=UPI001D114F76|nr:helix-turn-helix transcriptional regulator [Tessaracoccus sp. OS52]MCC2593359.1 helix-turn-helix domain-containing protein [Tessaracoccus sp. OS52]